MKTFMNNLKYIYTKGFFLLSLLAAKMHNYVVYFLKI